MSSVNRVILLGNIGKDPDVRYTPNGAAVANASLATSKKWKDKNTHEQHINTEWHRLVFFNRLAEIVSEHVKKGTKLYIEGSLQTKKWQDKDGKERYTTEILVDSIQMLGSNKDNELDENAGKKVYPPKTDALGKSDALPAGGAFEDDIPFGTYQRELYS